MKRLKQNQLIFFFPLFEIGGVEKNFFLISDFLIKKLINYNFFLITYENSYLLKKNLNKKINLVTSKIISFFLSRRIKFIMCMLMLTVKCIKFPNSVIFTFQGNFYALFVAYIFKRKIIVRSNLSPDAWCKNQFKKTIFKFLLSKSNLIIVNSFEFKKQFKKYFNLKVTSIYNPVSIEKKNNNLRLKKSFFRKNTINIINIGRLVVQKNQSELINALYKVKNRENFRLLIIGNGPEKNNLIKLLKEKKLDKIIKISSNQKTKSSYLAQSSIFILSSIYEGLPNVLLEAAVNKKYIISSDCPTGPKEIIKRYKYGELYKVKSENQLTNILNKFSLNKNLLIKLRKNINLNSVMFDNEYNLNQYYLNFIRAIK